MAPRHSRGFTLIELLVVIAIIGILAGLLMPVYTRARERAHQITCLGNIAQITQATLMYATDWDDTLPHHAWEAIVRGEPWSPIVVRVNEYVRDPRVWECPEAPRYRPEEDYALVQPWKDGYWNGVPAGGYMPFPREWNGVRPSVDWSQLLYVVGWNYLTGTGVTRGVRLGVISDPARVGMVADAAASEVMCGPEAPWPDVCGVDCDPSLRTAQNARHHGGINIGFCDGHAKWMNSRDLIAHCGQVWQYWEPPDEGIARWKKEWNWTCGTGACDF